MQRAVSIAIAVSLCLSACALADPEMDGLWGNWKERYGRQYKARSAEDRKRAVFEENARFVRRWNEDAMASHAQDAEMLQLNGFADMTRAEYATTLTFIPTQPQRPSRDPLPSNDAATLPEGIDYTELGLAGDVQDQGRCGSCWAFSVAGACSGAHAKASGTYVELSAQQFMDCWASGTGFGCAGGDTVPAAAYAVRKGVMPVADYPYAAATGRCQYANASVAARFASYAQLTPGSERALAEALVAHGPLSVALNASPAAFQFYGGGILKDRTCTPQALNHAAVLVGYTRAYWIVKNSWGTDWGLDGFVRIARNSNNMCGIATYATVVVAA